MALALQTRELRKTPSDKWLARSANAHEPIASIPGRGDEMVGSMYVAHAARLRSVLRAQLSVANW